MRRSDCFYRAVAYVLGVDADEIPWVDVETDWPGAWKAVRGYCLDRGWLLGYEDVREEPLLDYLARWGEVAYLWIAGVEHPAYTDGVETWSHAIVLNGAELAHDPSGDRGHPLDELRISGVYFLLPLDPGRFTYRPPT